METNVLREKESFYQPAYTLEEVADLVSLEMDEGLADELSAVRVAIRRTLEKMKEELEAAEFARMAALIFRGANTAAHLLRTRRAIRGQAVDGLLAAVAQAIQELETERDWKL
jgi:hypothetical protein